MGKFSDLKSSLDKFDQIMESHNDDRNSLPEFLNYLRGFLRVRDPKFTLPSAEIMTIIKKEKPVIFSLLKQQSPNHPSLELLTQLEIDYDKALERLQTLKSKL